MTDTPSPQDRELLTELGRIARTADPVPPLVADLARAAFGFRDLDAELAVLVDDSAAQLLAVRGPHLDERLLEFASDGLEIALQVSTGDGGPSVIGHLRADPPAPVVVTAESSSGQVLPPATADPQGRFFFPDLPPGSVRLRCTRSGARPVVTPWVALASSSSS